MRSRGLQILFLVAVLLLVYFFTVERPRENARRDARDSQNMLAVIDPDSVARVTVERPSNTISFQMRGTHWIVTAPITDKADHASINRIILAVSGARIFRDLGPSTDLARYGLLAPQAALDVEDTAGRRIVHLSIGDYTIDRSHVYALVESRNGVLLLPTGILRYLLYPLEDYRYKRATSFDISAVRAFTVVSDADSLTWTRRHDGWFTVCGDDTINGDTVAVEGILRRIRGLRAHSFPAPESTRPYFEHSNHRVDIVREAPAPVITLRVASSDSGSAYTHVTGEHRVVEVDSGVAVIFSQSLLDLRDRRLLHFDRASAVRVELAVADTTGTLIRTGSRWSHPNPTLPPPDEIRIAALFRHLGTIRFVNIVETPPGMWDRDVTFRVTVFDADGTIIDEVTGRGSPTPGRTVVTGPNLGLVVEVVTRDIDRFATMLRGMNSSQQ